MVVPTAHAPKLVEEILTDEMEELLKIEVQNKQELPKDDIATDNNISAAERSPRGTASRTVSGVSRPLCR
jgi:hypothetical protein